MRCLCGHGETDHVLGGRCRVPGCPCERFQPVPSIGADHVVAPRAARAAWALRRILAGAPRLSGHPICVPLGRVVMCLDCETCFALGAARCPACGSETWTLVARFLGERPPHQRSSVLAA